VRTVNGRLFCSYFCSCFYFTFVVVIDEVHNSEDVARYVLQMDVCINSYFCSPVCFVFTPSSSTRRTTSMTWRGAFVF
jgi:hypothetical protein